MPTKIKQDVIKFPIRKTRASAKLNQACENVSQNKYNSVSPKNIKKKTQNDIQNCIPIKSQDALKISPTKDCILYSSGTGKLHTPRKKKLNSATEDQENKCSPPKKSCTPNVDKTVRDCHVEIIDLNRTPLKSLKNSPNPDSPFKPSKNLITDSNIPNSPKFSRSLRFDSPNKNDFQDSSPVSCEKVETPNKNKFSGPLTFESPIRRSPRKLDFQNSPTSLISKLCVSSPKPLESVIGLHKSELKAYQLLKTSFAQNVNNKIVGRDTEIQFLEEFLKNHLKKTTPGSLYISGAPGTGKTALVTNIINNLKMEINFKQLFLNCMSKVTSKEIFSSIAESLKLSSSRTETEMISKIEKNITYSKIPIIIILDEVDQLESKDQNVLYTLFEWPSLKNSKLILVGIANMLDLTDRILPRLQSIQTFRPQLLHFPPYSKAEIIQIINERIKEANIDVQIIKPSAIHFLAGKISSVAGDVRKALDVCRRSVELCEIQARRQMRLIASRSLNKSPRKISDSVLKQVDIPQILTIFNEIYGSRVMTEITDNPNTFPLQQKVLICSLLLIIKHSKTKNITLGRFHEVYSRVCVRQKLPSVEQSEFFSLCTLLESRGMLQVKKSKELRNSKIILRLNEEEAETTLCDKVLLATILEDVASLGRGKK